MLWCRISTTIQLADYNP